MKSLVLFIFRIVVVVALSLWLVDQPGTAHIIWHNYAIDTSAAFIGFSILVVAFLFYLFFRFWHLLRHGPERWRLRKKMQKMRRGHEQLTNGLVALAGGDATEAGKCAIHARKFLGSTTMSQFLQAQAAQLAGDHRAAREVFRALAAHSDSAVLGYRGLIMEARRQQDWIEVEHLAKKLYETKPHTPWLNLIQFELLARRQAWSEAATVLDRIASLRLLEAGQTKTYRAAVLIAQSHSEAKKNHTEEALQAAERAAKHAPDFLPAIINLAQRQRAGGYHRAAHRTIEKNWSRITHPQLAAIYRTANPDPLKIYKQMETLCRHNESDGQSRLILAEAALAADLWGEARRHLMSLITHNQDTQSVYRLLARLERRESADEQGAAQWLTKAIDAAPDPTWLCRSCGGTHDEWHATCKHCGHFNSLEWQRPGMRRSQTKVSGNEILGIEWLATGF